MKKILIALITLISFSSMATIIDQEPNNTVSDSNVAVISSNDFIFGELADSSDECDYFRVANFTCGSMDFVREDIDSNVTTMLMWSSDSTGAGAVSVGEIPIGDTLTIEASGCDVYWIKATLTGGGFALYNVTISGLASYGGCPYWTQFEPEVRSEHCDANYTNFNTAEIVCTTTDLATHYDYRIIGGALNDTIQVGKFGRLKLQDIGGLGYNNSYTLYAAAVNGGQRGCWSPACSFTTTLSDPTLDVASCGMTTGNLYNAIYPTLISPATNYMYRFIEVGVDTNETEVGDAGRLRLKDMPGIVRGKTYDVQVAAKVNGSYGSYGSVCTITTTVITSQVQNAYCDGTYTNGNQSIYCNIISGATNYRYRFIQGTDTLTREIGQYGRLRFNQVGVAMSGVYSVDVASRIGGELGPYGDVCSITYGAARFGTFANAESLVSLYPQPTNDQSILELNLYADVLDVKVFDVSGIEVFNYSGGNTSTLAIGSDLNEGMYILHVVADGELIHTQKMIKN